MADRDEIPVFVSIGRAAADEWGGAQTERGAAEPLALPHLELSREQEAARRCGWLLQSSSGHGGPGVGCAGGPGGGAGRPEGAG